MLHLPRPRRGGRWRLHSPARRDRRRLPRAPAGRLCRRPARSCADELHRRQAGHARAARGGRLLCQFGNTASHGASARKRVGGRALSPGRRGAGARALRRVPRRAGPGHRPRQSPTRGPASRIPRRTAGTVAASQAAIRSGRRHASHQPAAESGGKRGSRGLCRCPSRGSSQSEISGSIPRSTSWRSQK